MFESMWTSINDLFGKVKEAAETVWDQLTQLPPRINQIVFDENFAVTKFLGLIHYILGTPLYALFCLTLLIGTGFILYKIVKQILNILQAIIPTLKGKIFIP